jgi:chromosomal replication initiation ATPase DnaA
MADVDPKHTFENFVVGPANRLASAAARRAADSPGRSYNPLFIYSASGMGKTHILAAVTHEAQRANGRRVMYQGAESYLEELADALRTGRQDELRERHRSLDVLLLDDVQFLAGQPQAQEMLLSTLDALASAGKQVVLASDRPPSEINELDARLLSRFSGGLIVDIAVPEYETRVAIIRRKTEEQGQTLQPGVAEALARYPFRSVRELSGALNRVLVEQELEGHPVTASDVAVLMGDKPKVELDDFDSFVREITGELANVVEAQEEPWRRALQQTAGAAEFEGYDAKRLRALLERADCPDEWEKVLADYKADQARLREIEAELDRLGNPWPDAAAALIRDPDRLVDAEALLASVRERQRPFPVLAAGPGLRELEGVVLPLALRAADQLIRQDRPRYNPLYVWSDPPDAARALLGATARSYGDVHKGKPAAVAAVPQLAEDFIRALSAGVVGAWRERWWTVDMLLVHGVQGLSETERVQDEFFHLFEALKRRGSRIFVAADRPPAKLEGIDERLRSRFEGGLVLQLGASALPSGSADLEMGEGPSPEHREWMEADVATVLEAPPDLSAGGEVAAPAAAAESSTPRWLPSPETVVWTWPRLDERIVEELE